MGIESGPNFSPFPVSTTSIVSDDALHKECSAARGQSDVSLYPIWGIGTPNIRLRFLRFVVRFRLVFLALRFLAM